MFKVRDITIDRPNTSVSFIVNDEVKLGETKTTVESIEVGIFRRVRVTLKNGIILVYRGFPIIYEI